MFSRDSEKTQRNTTSSSVIGTEMHISGNIKCSGNLVIKGKVKGNIECDHIHLASDGFLREILNPSFGSWWRFRR